MRMLTRDAILGASDKRIEPVEVPEWGGSVYVRTLTAGERDAFEHAVTTRPGQDIRARLAAYCVCDEQGNRIFRDSDIPALSGKSVAPLSRIFNASAKLNHLLKGDIEELEKNSASAPADSSSSA